MTLRLKLTARTNDLEVQYFLQKILQKQSQIHTENPLQFILLRELYHAYFFLFQCYKSLLSNN